MVYTRADDFERIVHVSELEERFAFYVCVCDIYGVESRWVVVEDSEKVVVVAKGIVVGVVLGGRDMQRGEVGHASKETGLWGWRLVARRGRLGGRC